MAPDLYLYLLCRFSVWIRRYLLLASPSLILILMFSACHSNTEDMTTSFRAFLYVMEHSESISRTEIGDGGTLFSLENGVLSVSDGDGNEWWRSQESWWVDDFRLGDVNGDGQQDFLFSLWKSYRFGEVNPARMENDDETVRNHLFLYTIVSGRVKPIWGSSDLPRPIYRFELDDTGEVTPVSSGMLLLTEEGEYREDFSRVEPVAHTYAWEGWGFVPLD